MIDNFNDGEAICLRFYLSGWEIELKLQINFEVFPPHPKMSMYIMIIDDYFNRILPNLT